MFKMVLLQFGATLVATAISAVFFGVVGAISAALAGLACVVPNGLFAIRLAAVARRTGSPPPSAFLVGELVKLMAIVGLLALVYALYEDLHWGGLFVGLILALKANLFAPTAKEYVVHHLTNLNQTGKGQYDIVDWSLINVDSLFWTLALGMLTVFMLWRAAKASTSGVPGRFQGFIEMMVEMVNDQAKDIVHSAESRKFVAPMALTVFIWIFFMNFMDLIPVDLIPMIWAETMVAMGVVASPGDAYMRVVPTADVNVPLGMAVAVLLMCFYYNVKIKGVGGWLHELVSAPFGNHPILWPVNFIMQMIEFFAKTVSHGLRLFGNLFAGELLFVLIALLGGTATVFGFFGHIIAGTVWAIFHVLIIVLQAFIFMMLTLVYVGQAHEGH
jgi:F-type H+-transporting ATPase subunit a